MPANLFFSVGEPSGDLHTAELIRQLQHVSDSVRVRGFCGKQMMEAGCQCDFDLTQLAVVGIAEVLPKIREFFRVADIASDVFDSESIDGVILVDFPGFNWHIAKRAKKRNIPVYYYLPPQLWAWGGWRIKKIRKYVDAVISTLPFEAEWYRKRGIATHYVGHPFFDQLNQKPGTENIASSPNNADRFVAVLPGSRNHEVHSIFPIQVAVMQRLAERHASIRFEVAALKEGHRDYCLEHLPQTLRSRTAIHVGQTSDIIENSHCVLSKSGSVSLELMARRKPTAIVYSVSPITYAVFRTLSRCNSITLPNMMAGETVMAEFLKVLRTERVVSLLTNELDRLWSEAAYHAERVEKLQKLSDQYAQPGASQRAADVLCNELGLQKRVTAKGETNAIDTSRSITALGAY